ncbi:ParB N-terminal domain-containing protein [Bradyrhizobium sp. AUGA SZCCT0177]|uniref:ParB N-terminal domain-containing protein n=1 Tax=Bradyrhizobium sp. AUGA SZCCT0177 TaxID=2807665 RepID=UPI001BAB2563|nr:ParB N-terminal domain-containing protein [Bradyrhizobium sp. AUGA SZCCT0177]MBR1285405.1 ParB N-terminal domain-containing protein [Bradyrhizobium sp. AUGA SZCCT0177]
MTKHEFKSGKRAAVLRLHSEVTYEDLKRIESTEERREEHPKALPRSAIIVADKVFQWRPPEEDMTRSEEHVRTLTRAIGTGKVRKPLDPVLVTAVGQFFYLVDGHHRMEAYHTAKWNKPIPVEVYQGSLRDARDEAFSRNYKDKLPMSLEAKSEAAWRRYLEGDLSRRDLVKRFRVAYGTVQNMKLAKEALRAKGEDPSEVRWRDARKHDWKSYEEFDYKAHASKAATELADQLKNVSNFTKRPEITARAIALVSAAMPQALADQWREDGAAAWEGDEAPYVIEPDIATALTIVAGQLQASGHGELARQIEGALQEALEERAESFRL